MSSKKRTWFAGVALIVVALAFAFPARATHGISDAPQQIVIALEASADLASINQQFGTQIIDEIPGEAIYLLAAPDNTSDLQTLIATLGELPDVRWSQENHPLTPMGGWTGSFFVGIPPDMFEPQGAGGQIDIPQGQGLGAGKIVAVLDTEIDDTHPLLLGRLIGASQHVNVDEVSSSDSENLLERGRMYGHGTFVAGVVALVAPEAQIMALRVLDEDGAGFAFEAAREIHRAVNNGADVINLSFGTTADINVLQNAMRVARRKGVIIVAAAGNFDEFLPRQFPASSEYSIAVAALDGADEKAWFSNYGDHITIAAPGESIIGPFPGAEFAEASGTSLSAALVSGACAAIWSVAPDQSDEFVIDCLLESAAELDQDTLYDLPFLYGDGTTMLGQGRLDLREAVRRARGHGNRPIGSGQPDMTGQP